MTIFSIITNIDFLGTNNAEHTSENPLANKKYLILLYD